MKIILLGYGKMGHEVEKIALQRGHEIIATIDNEEEFKNSGVQELKNSEDVVAIEFSTPATAYENIKRCFDLNIPVVCGTTAWYQHFDEVRERCEREGQALFYAPNFSIGMNIMFMLNSQLAKITEKYDYKLSLTETHHIHKLDKPSGTAVKLANDIVENNKNYNSWELTSDEAQTASDKALPITAIREGEFFGIHEVQAQSDCDIIKLSHEAFSRKGFASGAVIAAEFILGKKGLFTMNDLLNC
ncbi:MAG: 4-hydroxy-tetrahydrodipicolinate reductase [Bacteroidales bacterium]|nr:4-hydroxy-tetrahydrodipicolinate reductase [Bacteroidales bacterium]